ncbi:MAG: hypothetical protein M3Y71_18195 [Actinomycetota bacterium]|nr:hypothetical protein [Actinomycetota bacterium]
MRTTLPRSAVIGGGAAVLIAAAGTVGGFAAAHAVDTTPAPSATASTPGPSAGGASDGASGGHKHGKGDVVARLKGLQHAQWVVADKAGTFVTHDAIRGTVTAVSATSLTVKAKDGVSQTYAISSSTKVALRAVKGGAAGSTATATASGGAKGSAKGSLADVKSGTDVLVSGIGTSSLSAERIVVPQS